MYNSDFDSQQRQKTLTYQEQTQIEPSNLFQPLIRNYNQDEIQKIKTMLRFQLSTTVTRRGKTNLILKSLFSAELENKKYALFTNYPFEDYPAIKYSYLSHIQFPACLREAKLHLQFQLQNNNSEHQCFQTLGEFFSYLYLIADNCLTFNKDIPYYEKISQEFKQSIFQVYVKFRQLINQQYYIFQLNNPEELEYVVKTYSPFGRNIDDRSMPNKEKVDKLLEILDLLDDETQICIITSLIVDMNKIKLNKQNQLAEKHFTIDFFKLNRKQFVQFEKNVKTAAKKQLGEAKFNQLIKDMDMFNNDEQNELDDFLNINDDGPKYLFQYKNMREEKESKILKELFEVK